MPTHNKHLSHNRHTLFALTKMRLFGKEEDFGKINSLYLLNIESFKTHFLYLLKNCVMKNWIWGFLGNFWSSFLGKCTYYEWKLFPLKLSPICFVNTAFQIFSEFEREETGLMATLVAKKASGTCSKILLIFITFTVRKNRSAQTMFKLKCFQISFNPFFQKQFYKFIDELGIFPLVRDPEAV